MKKNFVHSWNGPWSEPKGQSWACTTEAQNRNQARLNFLNSPMRLQTQNMIFYVVGKINYAPKSLNFYCSSRN